MKSADEQQLLLQSTTAAGLRTHHQDQHHNVMAANRRRLSQQSLNIDKGHLNKCILQNKLVPVEPLRDKWTTCLSTFLLKKTVTAIKTEVVYLKTVLGFQCKHLKQ